MVQSQRSEQAAWVLSGGGGLAGMVFYWESGLSWVGFRARVGRGRFRAGGRDGDGGLREGSRGWGGGGSSGIYIRISISNINLLNSYQN